MAGAKGRPPKTTRKLSAEARAEIGVPRTCTECGDTKEVSEHTFAPYNKGFRGWHTVCRVCQGLAKSGKPTTLPAASLDDQDDVLITEMYFHHLTLTGDKSRLDVVVKELGNRVRNLYEKDPEASLRLFVQIVKPLIAGWMEPGPIHDDIIKGLLSPHLRRLIIATRYSAKSTLTAIFIAWRIFLDPLVKVMVISRGSKLAARMLRTVRQVFIGNCPLLAHLVPTEDCLDNAEQFQVPQTLAVTTGGATLTSLGISSNLPGFRADLTIGDDVEGPADDTPEKVEALEEALNELHMINPLGEKIMLGTYQSEFSIYAKLADRVTADGDSVWELHRACMFEEDELDGKRVIHSRWPAMFSDTDAIDWRHSVTERAWRLHAMLVADAAMLNERPLKISNFILYNHPPERPDFPLHIEPNGPVRAELTTWSAPKGDVWFGPRIVGSELSNYAQTIVGVDPASGLAGRDAIGVAVLGITPSGYGVIRHLEGVRGPDKLGNIKRVASIIAAFNATNVVVEELADGLFGETLEGQLMLVEHYMAVTKITSGGQQKGRRIIETLSPPLSAGRLVMLERVARSDHGGDFVNQLVRISWDGRTGKAKDHDDIVDALAHAVGYAKGSLISDIASNIGDFFIDKMDRWRGIPMRFGGLGADRAEFPNSRRIAMGSGLGDDLSLAEKLIEEDEVLIRLETRMARLQEVVQNDVRAGRMPHNETKNSIIHLKKQIEELKKQQVL